MTVAKRRPARFDVAKWAISETGKSRSRICSLCTNPEINAAIEEVIKLRRAGRSDVSARQVAVMLRDQFDARIGASMLAYCCAQHRGSPWSGHLPRG